MRFSHLIPMSVALNLLCPELSVALRPCRIPAALMSMPEAPVHHHGHTIPGQRHVRPAGQSAFLQSEPEPARMKPFPNQYLRFGILAAYAGHTLSALFWGQFIGHVQI
jgi:hypothetical protein